MTPFVRESWIELVVVRLPDSGEAERGEELARLELRPGGLHRSMPASCVSNRVDRTPAAHDGWRGRDDPGAVRHLLRALQRDARLWMPGRKRLRPLLLPERMFVPRRFLHRIPTGVPGQAAVPARVNVRGRPARVTGPGPATPIRGPTPSGLMIRIVRVTSEAERRRRLPARRLRRVRLRGEQNAHIQPISRWTSTELQPVARRVFRVPASPRRHADSRRGPAGPRQFQRDGVGLATALIGSRCSRSGRRGTRVRHAARPARRVAGVGRRRPPGRCTR